VGLRPPPLPSLLYQAAIGRSGVVLCASVSPAARRSANPRWRVLGLSQDLTGLLLCS
jgi:hypothetical protein